MSLKIFTVLILTVSGLIFPADFFRLSDLVQEEVKQDSMIWVANPVPDQEMKQDDTLYVDISYVFAIEPESADIFWGGIEITNTSETSPIQSATVTSGYDSLRVITKDVYGHAYIAYTANSSLGSATDEFLLRVERPDRSWLPLSGQYNFLPENCFGTLAGEWKAAAVFDLGSSGYLLDCIEFGYGLDGTADWVIVHFDGLPTDSVINGLSGNRTFNGGYSTFIEDLNKTLTGKIAVVFKTTSNFMAMEPSGNSKNTWIYSESSGWERPENISPDYSGEWYIRLYVLDPTGIEEVISAEKTPFLLKNYPNPFNNDTVIKWNMSRPGNAQIRIYNSKGEFVRNLAGKNFGSGIHSVTFDSSGLNSGVYYYELLIDGIRAGSNRMLYLK